MSIDSDLAFMLSDWGSVTVVLGEFSGRGLVDDVDVLDTDRSGDPVLVRKTVLRLRRVDFTDDAGAVTVIRGDVAVIDGVDYSVSDVRIGGADGANTGAELDGRELHVVVRKV